MRGWMVGAGFAVVGWIGGSIGGGDRTEGGMAKVGEADGLPGPAILGAVIGGLRGPLGDLVWLRGNREWADENAEGVLRNLELVYWLRPEAIHFRIEGARTIAYDFPQWDSGRRAAGREEWVELSLEHLDRAMADLGRNGYLLATKGEILFRGKDDPGGAARLYREAAATGEAGFFFNDAADYLEGLAE